MATRDFEVWLDEEHQIVRQKLNTPPSLTQFLQISDQTGECALQLRNPDEVRILIEGEGLERFPKVVRTATIDTLKQPTLKRVAIVTSRRLVRIMIRFLVTATGTQKLKTFSHQEEALRWLQL